jgi:hypothetical protein
MNTLKENLSEYFNENYFFIEAEIYSYFNKKPVIFFIHKKDLYYNRNKERIEKLNHLGFLEENNYPNEWITYDKSIHIKWFTDEFKMKDLKYKSTDIKIALIEMFESFNLSKKLKLPNEIIEILKNKRIDCNKIKTIENELERENQNFSLNEIIYYNEEKSKLSNPGLILNNDSNENLKILYFTNLDKYNFESNKSEINAWNIKKVTNKEIGKTPEQAKQYSY